MSNELKHYGMKKRSGRYPWGSGEHPFQRSADFLARVDELKKQGLSETEIAKSIGLTTTELRVQKQLANHERDRLIYDQVKSLKEDGLSNPKIAEKLGLAGESSVRSILNENTAARRSRATNTAELLKEIQAEKGIIDIGAGVERELNVSKQVMDEAVYMLEREGYNVYNLKVPQATNPMQKTTVTVLAPEDVTYNDAWKQIDNVQPVMDYCSNDGGKTYRKAEYPASIDADRVQIRYGDEGGLERDGLIELRRGCADLTMGDAHYAQVRILVNNEAYLKGMAVYSDDLPDGVDIRFNTNKQSGTDKMKVLKSIKDDPENPFGADIRPQGQTFYTDENGEQKLSAVNKVKEEGDWERMSKNLSSQFLSKQPVSLIKSQLDLTYKDMEADFDEICSLENVTVKRELLNDFASNCDSAAVHLKAAALPRQSTKVILPVPDLKDNECYAPTYKDGEQVALIRYPHAGPFEIPILTVNNKNKGGKDLIGPDAMDAIGIGFKSAEKLSGADFDGDQVVCIPLSSKVSIKSTTLKDLEGFDPKVEYSTEGKTGVRLMKKSDVGKEMGMASNLITDMTLGGAKESEIARAVKHSMVIIDAYKHELDYKQSEKDFGIAELRKRYQVRVDSEGNIKVGGASTLISRANAEVYDDERKGSAQINKETGAVSYKKSGRTYIDKNGKEVKAQIKVKQMSIIDDAYELSTGTRKENLYADHANKLKALANKARKEAIDVGRSKYNSEAAKVYEKEVQSLKNKLNVAESNAPKERYAQIIANNEIKAKTQGITMEKKDKKKLANIAINNARNKVGASGKDSRVTITDREWEAIQAGAVSDSIVTSLFKKSDKTSFKERAMPRNKDTLSTAKINKIEALRASGYTLAQIADRMGYSTSTISRYIKN